MAEKNGGIIRFGIKFESDQANLQKLKRSLQDLQKIEIADFKGTIKDLNKIKDTAKQIELALQKSFNPALGITNIQTFQSELKNSVGNIDAVYNTLKKAGPQGQAAFHSLATEVLTANLQLKQTYSLVDSMGKTMFNTIKWGIASSVMNTFTQTVHGAFTYVEGLDKSLTNIRIVTGDSAEKMAQFADQANRSAQALGRSTLDYSKASLTFYQQGLNDEDVQARTEATLKAQNITGAGEEMADYLTAVWNGYKVANEEAELYVDKLAAVADSSASDMSELAIAMSKVASTANSLGVSADSLNAQIATVVATTRQAPESVGTAFKTVYARINDIKTGSDEAEISLGNYSGKMAQLGFNVLDATGRLRETEEVMTEIGERWKTLSKEQQIYLAQTMGGQRQVNQLMALFDNWQTYTELLNISLEAEGTLTEKNARYMESLGAKMEQLGAAGERVKAALINEDELKGGINALTQIVNLMGTFIESIGGGSNALLALGSIATNIFQKTIARQLNDIITNYQMRINNEKLKQQDIQQTELFGKSKGYNQDVITNLVDRKKEILPFYDVMSQEEINIYNNLVRIVAAEEQHKAALEASQKAAEDFEKKLRKIPNVARDLKEDLVGTALAFQDAAIQAGDAIRKNWNLRSIKQDSADFLMDVQIEWNDLIKNFGGEQAFEKLKSYKGFEKDYLKALDELTYKGEVTDKSINALYRSWLAFTKELRLQSHNLAGLDHTNEQLEKTKARLEVANREAKRFKESVEQMSTIKIFTDLFSSVTRLTSGLVSLGNVVDTIFNKNLSPAQKFVKVMMGLGYALPSIYSGYQKLSKDVSAVIIKITQLTTATQAQAGASQAQAAATAQAAAAQQGLNAAMNFNPIILGITAFIAALIIVPKIYDAINTSAEEAAQAIQKFNNAQKEASQKYAQGQSDIKTLSGAKEEWERLSKAAGNYNSTIENLSDEEKTRYYELSNMIAKYNSTAVIGYDAQGNAIISKNVELEKEIELIKQATEQQKRRFYNSKEYKQGVKGQKVEEDNARDRLNAYTQQPKVDYARSLRSSMEYAKEILEYNPKYYKDRIEKYNNFLKLSEKELIENEAEIYQTLLQDEEKLSIAYGNKLGEVKAKGQLYKNAVQENEKLSQEYAQKSQLNYTSLFDQLELNSDAYNQIKELGSVNIEDLIISYVEGSKEAFSRANLGADTYKSAAQKLNKDLLEAFLNAITQQDSEGNKIDLNNLFGQFITTDQTQNGTKDWTFKTLQGKSQVLSTQINRFLEEQSEETIEAIRSAKGTPMEKVWEDYFAELLNVDKVQINFDEGKIQKITSEGLERLKNKIKTALGRENDQDLDIMIGTYLRPSLTDSQLDEVGKRFLTLVSDTDDWTESLKQAQRQVTQLAISVNTPTSMNLLNSYVAGDKLKEEQQTQLFSTLQDLTSLYSPLRDEVAILNTEWLKGTTSYEHALRSVKDALLYTMEASKEAVRGTLEEMQAAYAQANSNAVASVFSMEDIQSADTLGLFNALDEHGNEVKNVDAYNDALLKVSSQYETCKDELEKFTIALRTNNEQLTEEARSELERAARAAELGAESGTTNRIEGMIESYERLAQAQKNAGNAEEGFYSQMLQSSEITAKVADDYVNFNDGIQALGKSYDDIHKLFTKTNQVIGEDSVEAAVAMINASEEMSGTFDKLKGGLADVLAISEDLLSDDWILENAEDIEKAIAGDEEAIKSLKDSAFENNLIELGIDQNKLLEDLGASEDSITELIDNIPLGTIDLDNTPAIQALYDLLSEAGYTDEQIKSLLADQGIYIDTQPAIENLDAMADAAIDDTDTLIKATNINAETVSSNNPVTDTEQHISFEEQVQAVPHTYTNMVMQDPMSNPTPATTRYYAVTKRVVPLTSEEVETKDNTATAMKVSNAFNAGKGGKVSHRNKNGGAKPASKGGGKGGKGGGGKGKTPSQAKPATDKADRYRNNTVKANKLANEMTRLQKQSNRLSGKDKIDNLKEQLQILEKQNRVIRERINLQRGQQAQLANNLKVYGATFDKDGTLNNYFSVHAKILDEYNKKVTEWNSMSADDQQKNKDFLNNAKQIMDQALKDLQQYDKLQQENAKSIQEQIDNAQEQINNKVQQLEIKIEATLDLAKLKRDWNAFRRDIVKELRDDDILGLNDFRFADINSYFNQGGTGSIQQLADKLATITKSDTGVFSASYLNEKLKEMSVKDRAAQLKEIESILNSLTSEMTDFKELADEIKQSIFDTIDAAQAAFDEQMDEYEFLGDTLEHNKKLIQLMYGDEAYEAMGKYYDEIQKNNNSQLDFLAKEKDLWYGRMMEEQARMKRLAQTEGADSNAYKESQDRFKEYEKHWMDSVKNLNATLEDALENITDQYNNIIDETFLRYEKMMGGGHTLDDIKDEWDMLNNTADTYLDKINSAYEMEKLNNAFEDAIRENEGNVAAQQSLNDLMQQQLGYLRDKEKLTQYDVDRANTLLQIEIKRLALEQARSSKNRLRLRRDSQGNYTYQYTADTESISKAEQELADARNSLQNSDKAAYVDNLNAIQKSADTLKQKLEDIWKDQNLSKEQKLQKSYELQKYYGQQINDLLAENAVIRNNLMESSFEELAKIYGISADQFRAMSKEQQNELMKDLVPQTGSYIAQWVDNVMSNGGYTPYFEQMVDEMEKADDERRQKQVDALDKAQKNMENITNDVDILTQQMRRLIEPNDELINKHKQEIEQVTEYIVYLNKVLDMYQKIKEDATAAASAAYAVLKADAAGTLGSTLERENRVASNEKKARESYFKKNNSASDLGPDYKPYQPEFQSNDYAAIFGSFSGDELSVLQKQKADEIKNNTTLSEEQKQQALQKQDSLFYTVTRDINISSVLDSIEEGVLNINTLLNSIYLANDTFFKNSLNKQDDIKSTIANQTISINADFPNAKDVQAIIQAIESLPAKAAQYAGKV